jgi:dihydrofolate reductase
MGRKTWDSIPQKFRPLKGRVNVVVTRNPDTAAFKDAAKSEEEGPIIVGSVSAALEALHPDNTSHSSLSNLQIERVFVIGGASIYKAALGLPQCERVLLTEIKNEFECDTFFPLALDGEEGRSEGWKRRSKEELQSWVGEEVEEVVEEKGVRFEFLMYERKFGG